MLAAEVTCICTVYSEEPIPRPISTAPLSANYVVSQTCRYHPLLKGSNEGRKVGPWVLEPPQVYRELQDKHNTTHLRKRVVSVVE